MLIDETQEGDRRDFERIKSTILAGNIELYKALFEKDEIDEEGIQWIQPGTPEYDVLLEDLQRTKTSRA